MAHLRTPLKITQTGAYPEREIYSVGAGVRVPFAGPDLIACAQAAGSPGENVFAGITPRIYQIDNCIASDVGTLLIGGPQLEIRPYRRPLAGTFTPSAGGILFRIGCATEIVFNISGWMRANFDGRDWVEILLNGVRAYYYESVRADGVAYWIANGGDPVTGPDDHYLYPETDALALPLPSLPCGNLIEVRGGTGPVHATEEEGGLGWTLTITSLT